MSRTSKIAFLSKLAAVGLVALALAGCGRKGGLDLPPDAASAQVAPGGEVRTGESRPQGAAGAATAQGNVYDATAGRGRFAVAPRGEKKRIILDPILD